jgi:hypothetical protein
MGERTGKAEERTSSAGGLTGEGRGGRGQATVDDAKQAAHSAVAEVLEKLETTVHTSR